MSEHWPPKNRPMEYVIRFEDGSYLGVHEETGTPFNAKRLRDAAIYSYDELKASRLYLWKYIGPNSEYKFDGLDQEYIVCCLSDDICGLRTYIEEGWPE